MKTKKITFATPGFSATMREITQIVFQRAIECPVGWQHFYDAITGNVGATLDEAAAHVATLCPKYESVTAVLDDVYVKPVGTTEAGRRHRQLRQHDRTAGTGLGSSGRPCQDRRI